MHLARIVIGVDLTNSSLHAAAWAAQHFAPEADVVLLHCISPLLPERKLARERRRAAGHLSYLAARLGVSRCTYRIQVGDPARALADLAAEVDADLIAVGEHEHADRAPELKSTAEQLVRCSAIPVLLCVERRSSAPRSVLLPLPSPDVGTSIAEWTEELADRFDARVVLVHVQAPGAAPTATRATIVEKPVEPSKPWTLVGQHLPQERVLVDAVLGEQGDAVLAEARRFDSDLVLFATPPEDRGDRPSPVDRVLRSSECAVLVVPPLEHPPLEDNR